MKFKSFNPATVQGNQNLREFKKKRKNFRILRNTYAFAFCTSIFFSFYGGTTLPLRLAFLTLIIAVFAELLQAFSMLVNKPTAAHVGIIISIITAGFSGHVIIENSNNSTGKIDFLIDQQKQEVERLKPTDQLNDEHLLSANLKINKLSDRKNKLLHKNYRIKFFRNSRTQTLSGSELLTKSCYSSTTCKKVKSDIRLLTNQIVAATRSASMLQSNFELQASKETAYLKAKQKLESLLQQQSNSITVPIALAIAIILAAIVVLEYIKYILRAGINSVRYEYQLIESHYISWRIAEKNNKPKTNWFKRIFTHFKKSKPTKNHSITKRSSAQKPAPNVEQIAEICAVLKTRSQNLEVKITHAMINEILSQQGFGKTIKNYRLVSDHLKKLTTQQEG